MRKTTTAAIASPAATLDSEVVEFRSQLDKTSPLDELVRTGARRMLQSASGLTDTVWSVRELLERAAEV